MIIMMGLASSALPSAALLALAQDGLTLEPLAITQRPLAQDEDDRILTANEPDTPEAMSLMERPLLPDIEKSALPKKSAPDDRSGFIYEPVYSSTSDRIQYQTGSGLGLGVTTDASLTVSQSVRLRRGLDLTVYYAQPMEGTLRDTPPENITDPKSIPSAPSAGIRLEWKF